jgi:hypothetical protein
MSCQSRVRNDNSREMKLAKRRADAANLEVRAIIQESYNWQNLGVQEIHGKQFLCCRNSS